MSVPTVLFDIGGTLLDSGDLVETITRRLVEKWPTRRTYRIVEDTFIQVYVSTRDSKVFLTVEQIVASTLRLLARDHRYPDMSADARDIYYETFLNKSSLFPETLTVLGVLQKNNVRMIIASDADPEIMQKELERHGLTAYFADKVLSGSLKCYKPSSEFIRHLKKYVPDQVENCYFVGDSKVDVESGRRLGVKSVLVDRKNSRQKTDADYVIHNLNEFLTILRIQ